MRKVSLPQVYNTTVTHHWLHDWAGRRHAQGPMVAQTVDQRLQKLVLSQTVDLDISNAMFVILKQVLERLDVVDKVQWAEELSTLTDLAVRRDDICKEELQMTVPHGKRTLHAIACGGGVQVPSVALHRADAPHLPGAVQRQRRQVARGTGA